MDLGNRAYFTDKENNTQRSEWQVTTGTKEEAMPQLPHLITTKHDILTACPVSGTVQSTLCQLSISGNFFNNLRKTGTSITSN